MITRLCCLYNSNMSRLAEQKFPGTITFAAKQGATYNSERFRILRTAS